MKSELLTQDEAPALPAGPTSLLEVTDLVVRYGKQLAVDGISFSVSRGEFVAILGASGCGKTTTLRAIAGLERISGGKIVIDGSHVATGTQHVPPQKRNVNMVFQSYAVWPHMTVFDNVAYGLRGRKMPDLRAHVDEILRSVGLGDYSRRLGTELSGGQQQRVALARAVATRSALILYDEPLSSLDAALRARMRAEIMDLHRTFHTTSIYVTHDQSEALTMADRIVVMDAARVAQIGSPREIYLRPRNEFVARFVGVANIASATITSVDGHSHSYIAQLDDCPDIRVEIRGDDNDPPRRGAKGQIMFRPEAVTLRRSAATARDGRSDPDPTANHWSGTVIQALYVGPRIDCEVLVAGWLIRGELGGDEDVRLGDTVDVYVDPARSTWLPHESDRLSQEGG